jgi:hypothetical protein
MVGCMITWLQLPSLCFLYRLYILHMTRHNRKTLKKGGWLFGSNTTPPAEQDESKSWSAWVSNLFKSKPVEAAASQPDSAAASSSAPSTEPVESKTMSSQQPAPIAGGRRKRKVVGGSRKRKGGSKTCKKRCRK